MNPPMGSSSSTQPCVSSVVVVPSPSRTCRPSMSTRSASAVGAITSITSADNAASAVMLSADRTNDSAMSALRPYVSARLLM